MFGFEMQYRFCEPRIIAEEYMDNDGDLFDYKLFCFNGRVDSIMFLAERRKGLKMAFFDREWNRLPYVYSFPQLMRDVPRPAQLDELIALAEVLAEGLPLVRVDFYVLNDGSIRFGEMTFTSASGTCAWDPSETDLELGRKIDLSACPKAVEYPWCG